MIFYIMMLGTVVRVGVHTRIFTWVIYYTDICINAQWYQKTLTFVSTVQWYQKTLNSVSNCVVISNCTEVCIKLRGCIKLH